MAKLTCLLLSALALQVCAISAIPADRDGTEALIVEYIP